jgi:hypothetical protein
MNVTRRVFTILAIIGVGLLTMVAVAQMASGTIGIGRGVPFTIAGVIMLAVAITTSTRHWINFTRFYVVLLFSGLFVFIGCVYLNVDSFGDIKTSYAAALSGESGNFTSNVDLTIPEAKPSSEAETASTTESSPQLIPVGAKAPDFVLTNTGGQPMRLKDLGGYGYSLVINFWEVG